MTDATKATKPIAKSLHTVSVILAVARDVISRNAARQNAEAIAEAMRILGLEGRADPQQLEANATRILNAHRPNG